MFDHNNNFYYFFRNKKTSDLTFFKESYNYVIDLDIAYKDRFSSLTFKDIKNTQHALLLFLCKFNSMFDQDGQYYFFTHGVHLHDSYVENNFPFSYLTNNTLTTHYKKDVLVEYLAELNLDLPESWMSENSHWFTASNQLLFKNEEIFKKMLNVCEKYPQSHDFLQSLWGFILNKEKYAIE